MDMATQFEQVTADNPNNPYALDARLSVRFENKPVKDEKRSAEEGRPIYKDVVYIEIRTPGDRDNILLRPMTSVDRKRFEDRYEKWLKTQSDEEMDGTPLSEWPAMPRRIVEEMRYFGVFTVEQLADLSDSHIKKSREIYGWRQKAKDYLDVASRGAAASKLAKEKEDLESRFAAQQLAITEQATLIKQLQEKLGV